MAIQGYGNWKLPDELVALSIGRAYPGVLSEWRLSYIEKLEDGEDSETCLCHHHPIREVCHIENRENGNAAIVGNCCVKKFEDEDNQAFRGTHKIFDSFNRIVRDRNASANEELIQYAYDQQVLHKEEYDFYIDIWRKRDISDLSLERKRQLNEVIIACVSEPNRRDELIQAAIKRPLENLLNTLRNSPTKLADRRLIDLAFQQQILNPKDNHFYNDILTRRVRRPTEKQQKWINSLNNRIIQQLRI